MASVNEAVEVIERQDWLEPLEDRLQNCVQSTYEALGDAGRQAKDFLHGKWLGHPLHSALTDVPVGAWTAAAVLDVAGSPAADAAIKVGLGGAAAAAIAGWTDWHVTDGASRRIGLVHGLMNVGAVGLYAASLAKRADGDRTTGRLLAFAGFAVAMASSFLGGKLVYSQRVGVTHSPAAEEPKDFVPVLGDAELSENQMRQVEVNGSKVLLTRRSGQVHAIGDVCAHLGGPLSEGKLEGDVVECPWHGSRFSVIDGSVVNGPSVHPQACYETRVREGQIEVRAAERC
jgi:nitrite reductase/ring-hydroxylating ferredoxin subunit